jgi:hypothetical protein
MKRPNLTLICILALLSVTAAQAGAPSDDQAYSSAPKTNIFYDGFDNNTNEWWTGTTPGVEQGKIENGYYQYESFRKNSARLTFRKVSIDTDSDFEIEASIKFVKGAKEYFQGLCWGRDPADDSDFRFGFAETGYYRITKYVKGEWRDYVPWTQSQWVNPTAYNKLTIRKIKRQYYFFLNGNLVHSMPFEPFWGHDIAFLANAHSAIRVDYLRVSYFSSDSYTYPSSQKTTVFFDDFDNNAHGWWTGKNYGVEQGKIENGCYYYESFEKESARTIWKAIPLDESKDFEIEASIKFVKGADNFFQGLCWGRDTKLDNDFRFGFAGTGYYRISKSVRGDWKDYVPWESSPLVNRTSYNKLTVRKIKDQYQFFLNEKWIYSMPFEPFWDQKIAFLANKGSAIQVDYLRVSYLQKEPENAPPELIITEPQIDRGINVVSLQSTRIAGRATDSDGIRQVLVNGRDAHVKADGSFAVDLPLALGENTISITATDRKMKSVSREFSIRRKPEVKETPEIIPQERRLALLIGNSNYQYGGKLPNPVNDVRAMKKVLEDLHFTVMMDENSDQKHMKRAIDEFGRRLNGHGVGLFFYAGHGVQVNGHNYLIPVDAKLENENDVEYDSVRADRVLAKMENAGSKTNIVILDACRDNPFERSWHRGAKGNGLAFMNAPSGSIIAYATSPGTTASDGPGNNGLYTSAILKHITTGNITIEKMFKLVRATIMEESEGKQVPWESTSLRGDFYFKRQSSRP